MAVIETSATLNGNSSGLYRLRTSLRSAVWTYHNWNNKRITRNALSKLSNRELDDIGLSRGDLSNF